NNKYLLHQHLSSQGLPVFDTCMAKDQDEVTSSIRALEKLGYTSGVLKAQVGASGIGMVRLEFNHPLPAPDYLFHEGPCLVQGWLTDGQGVHFVGSPSVQM